MSETRSANMCAYTFADGRRCRALRSSGLLCYFHARKQAQTQAAEKTGRDISYFLSGDYLSACDLSLALGRLFAATARGDIKPRTASTLAYLGQTLLQTIQLAEHEYTEAFGDDSWRGIIRSHASENENYLTPSLPEQPPQTTAKVPQSAPQPPAPVPCSAGFIPAPSLSPAAPSPVAAGLQAGSALAPTPPSSSPAAPSPVAAGLQPGPTLTPTPPSSSPAAPPPKAKPKSQPAPASQPASVKQPPPAPQSPVSVTGHGSRTTVHGAEAEPRPGSALAPTRLKETASLPAVVASAIAPGNPAPPSAAPPSTSAQIPKPAAAPPTNNSSPAPSKPTAPPTPASQLPGFGAPANWDALIPLRPAFGRRRRQLRPWH